MQKVILTLLAVGAFSLISIMPACDGRSGSPHTNSAINDVLIDII